MKITKLVKEYLEKKHNLVVSSIYKIGDNVDDTITEDCVISYFVDINSTPGYSRFNMNQMLNVVKIDFSDLLSYVRKKKLENLKK